MHESIIITCSRTPLIRSMLLHFLGPDLNPIDSRALCFHLIRRYSVMFPSYIVGERSGHINLEVQREICCRK